MRRGRLARRERYVSERTVRTERTGALSILRSAYSVSNPHDSNP